MGRRGQARRARRRRRRDNPGLLLLPLLCLILMVAACAGWGCWVGGWTRRVCAARFNTLMQE